ncbi:Serine aminopeptidase, S33 [Teratosphaeria destructans]|uniref:Serine aminopeptidase, S33 n=1 Tax=Teratosphaeria destructans TaxID=418781 RepID=A0A9W7W1A2_9PEZI|nr:Serine aminopeptidase, S33 [Teratosphaeria destructans]
MSTQARDKLHTLLASSFFTLTSTWQRSISSLVTAAFGLVLFRSWRAGRLDPLLHPIRSKREASEPGLFQRYSTVHTITTASGLTYPSIRVFCHRHAQAEKLPRDLPLLVCMHGLGGNATQFAPLLTSLINVASCVAIDLPGCGLSDFKPDDPQAYTTAAFAELLAAVIDQYRDKSNHQHVVLVGHSMGCAIAALLASSTSPLRARLDLDHVVGLIAICPKAVPSAHETAMTQRLRSTPRFVFDLFRFFDRRGGLQSRSITRMVGESADVETRRRQHQYNSQSKTATLLRMLTGTLTSHDGHQQTGWPGREVWAGIQVPLFLVAGEADEVTSPHEVEQIADWLNSRETAADQPKVVEVEQQPKIVVTHSEVDDETAPDAPSSAPSSDALASTARDVQLAQDHLSSDHDLPPSNTKAHPQSNATIDNTFDPATSNTSEHPLKITILPAPAAHGLLYSTHTVRILSGLIEKFLSQHVDERLGLGWQLQHLTTSGKWDVKNLAKWSKIDRCSDPIGGVFRAMKTMREVDEVHNPRHFVQEFGVKSRGDGVAIVVDISHESPVYDPRGLEEGGVQYYKSPTVSKLPPTADEVEQFIALIDQLRRSPQCQRRDGADVSPTIGVHCHYGFNRYVPSFAPHRLDSSFANGSDKNRLLHRLLPRRAPGLPARRRHRRVRRQAGPGHQARAFRQRAVCAVRGADAAARDAGGCWGAVMWRCHVMACPMGEGMCHVCCMIPKAFRCRDFNEKRGNEFLLMLVVVVSIAVCGSSGC